MTLQLHRGTRTDLLADGLGDLLRTPLADPFAEEVVIVPAKGVERWLTQRLSHRLGTGPRGGDGVCAGVRFLSPRSLVAMLLGIERDDAWDPDRLVWPLLATIDAALDEPWCRPLAVHLGAGRTGVEAELRQGRRWSVARRLAGLFASYAVQRPRLLTEWHEGRDTDGAGESLEADLAWQAELWRRLLPRIAAPPPDVRHAATLAAIGAGAVLDLPDRLSLFGHTRLPVTEIELLRAVAEHRDVHLWLPQASETLWSALATEVAGGPVVRADDVTTARVQHPLLASLGRDSRELQRALAALGPVTEAAPLATNRSGGDSLLGWLQDDLHADRPGDPTSRRLRPDDTSVQIHACHGTARQVDVLREVLVGLLEDDVTLEPRDILVMCPDIEAYAPLFQAGFGLGSLVDGGHPAHTLRVRLADRGLASTNPLLAVAAQVVGIAGGRATATQVLDLAAAAPVRHRFGFSEDDLATLATWVEQSGVRWGLTSELRAPYSLQAFPQNTWAAGLDRILLGVAMAEEDHRWLATALPLDAVASGAVDLAGRFGEYVDRLETACSRLRDTVALADWMKVLGGTVRALGSVPPRDAWQLAQFDREIESVTASGRTDDAGVPLRLGDLRALLETRLQGRPTRANFRTGTLTVATLVPMRSVPHRVVCLVGLDDDVFPRSPAPDGDDVLGRRPITGERDLRSEDRQLLLDAVLAARERLVITYTGANEHSGQSRPPAVPLGELVDALDVTAAAPGGEVRDQVVHRHPLQPFDERNLTPGALGGPGPFSFDTAALAGAESARRERAAVTTLVPRLLPARPPGDVALTDLQAFFAHPARAFLRQRLDVAVLEEVEELSDAMPVQIDALEDWAVGDRILRRAMAGADQFSAMLAEQLRGELPPGRLGERLLRGIVERVGALLAATTQLRELAPRSIDVTVDLGGGRRLTGVVPDVRGNRIFRCHYSQLGPRHRLASWVDLVALSAALDDFPWTALTVGWHRVGSPQMSLLGPLDHAASQLLRDLVDVYDRGMRGPVPLPLKTAHEFADKVRVGKEPAYSARQKWETAFEGGFPGEQDDRYYARVYGDRAGFETLLAAPDADERWNAQSTRLGQYALRVWAPLFDHETVRQA